MSASPKTRLGAALLVWAFTVSNLAALIHEATTTHSRCPEHGELVDGVAVTPSADDAAGLAAGVALAGRPVGAAGQAASLRSLPGGERHDHDHCTISCAPRERVVDPDRIDLTRPAELLARDPVAVAAGAWLPARPLYRTAPKTSPPRA